MNNRTLPILVVAEDVKLCQSLREMMTRNGFFEVSVVHSGMSALDLIRKEEFIIVIADLKLRDMPGIDLLKAIKTDKPETELIMLTAQDGTDLGLESMKLGAFGFLAEPYLAPDLIQLIERARTYYESLLEIKRLKGEIKKLSNQTEIIGIHPKIIRINEIIESAACSDSAVLIRGKSGTGKELTARAIHKRSLRTDFPFQTVNCGVFTETALELELFGQEGDSSRGIHRTVGKVESASGGCLFLDEIDTMTRSLQEKLYRAVQDGVFARAGGTKFIPANFRLMAATTSDIQQLVMQKLFLPELFIRLNDITFTLPDLAERASDVPLLVTYFLSRCQATGVAKTISPAALDLLVQYRWPGNVRELMNAVEYGLVMAKGSQIQPCDLPLAIQGAKEAGPDRPFVSLRETERELIMRTLKECRGNKHLTAKLLRIPRSTLYSKIQKHGISIDVKNDLVYHTLENKQAAGSG